MARTLLIALLLPVCAAAQSTATTTLSVTVATAATISINNSSTALKASTTWGDYTGSVPVRTSKTGGSGSVTVEITSAFVTGGPSVSDLSYTCTVAEGSDATACSDSVSASASTGTSVLTMGADGHTTDSGDSFSVEWSLDNLPSYTPDSYSATATFTASAT